MASAGRILIMPKGAYNAGTTYEMLDLIKHNGTSWIAKKTAVGIEPSAANSEYWQDVFDSDAVFDDKIAELDSGWNFAVLESSFAAQSETNKLRYRKIGKIVYLRGIIKAAADITAGSVTQICALPEGYRPIGGDVIGVMQGEGMAQWSITISPDGAVKEQKFGTSAETNITTNSTLNIDISYLAD